MKDRMHALVAFWKEAGPSKWFSRDEAFDTEFREAFSDVYAAAKAGELDHWLESAEGALALLIALDQYPRNSFRGTPAVYATDVLALGYAREAVKRGHDGEVDAALRAFFYLPWMHSESLEDQDESVRLAERMGDASQTYKYAKHHRDIVKRFGRFPHRNEILGRETTEEEATYLADGGFSG